MAINCATIAPNLLESELFGYVEGAFTGARHGGKIGLFELAHRGTLFLDEISEISMSLQSKLLRVLQEREVRRIGGDRVIAIDVRIIAATNKNFKRAGQGREIQKRPFVPSGRFENLCSAFKKKTAGYYDFASLLSGKESESEGASDGGAS